MKVNKIPSTWISLVMVLVFISLTAACTAQPTQEEDSTQGAEIQTLPPTIPTSIENTPTALVTQISEPATTTSPTEPEIQPMNEIIPLTNPGFEMSESDGSPTGWTSTGAAEAVIIEDRGHSGEFRLTHKADHVYLVETSQTIQGLTNGWYTMGAWVRSSGEQKEVYIALECSGNEKRTHVPVTTPGYRWVRLVVSNQVTDGECTVRLHSDANPENWASFDDIELIRGQAMLSILGADVSSLKKSEDMGGVYKYSDGTQADALQILKDNGLNYVRLRVWVDPPDGYHEKDELLVMAKRAKDLGIKVLVDFHYSDHWADPGKQIKPAAWAELDFEALKQAVYDHTYEICKSLVDQGTPPDMVQVGNEINAGMLWPDGDYNHFDNLAELLMAGYNATKDCSSTTLVMLHIAEGGDNDLARWWFDNITQREVPYDLIGISYYPFWHGSLAELQSNLNDISERYSKDVIVVETAYAFTDQGDDSLANIASSDMASPGYPFTPEGQRTMLRDIMTIVRSVNAGRGVGVFYWDATWTAVPGNGWDATDPNSENAWENQALFDYDDRALPAQEEYLAP